MKKPKKLKEETYKDFQALLMTHLSWRPDFPGGAVVKNLPANAGDAGSIPGPGRSHMPWSN